MTKPKAATGWSNVEPPDIHYEPQEDYDLLEGFYYPEPGVDPTILTEREYLDGATAHVLFENVRISDTEGSASFSVPKRIVATPEFGRWVFQVFGRAKHFKERDEYGEVRFTTSGDSFWVPHLYPFEETDDKGLPLIRDRERCEMWVTLQPIQRPEYLPLSVAVQTQTSRLGAGEDAMSYNPDQISYFREFEYQDRLLQAETVTWPKEKWRTFAQFIHEKFPDMSQQDYYDIVLGRQDFPLAEEYLAQFKPENWQTRQPSKFTGKAFGSIWVPIDELRRGIDALISFPCFDNQPVETAD